MRSFLEDKKGGCLIDNFEAQTNGFEMLAISLRLVERNI